MSTAQHNHDTDVEPNFATGLRALADLLDANPSAKRSYDDYGHLICVNDREELLATIRALGGKWVKDENPGTYFGMTRDLGNGVTVYVYTNRRNVCERKVVGTRTVIRPAPDAPTIEVEEEIVEWVCPPSVLAEVKS